MCAFVPFQIIMYPLIVMTVDPQALRHLSGVAVVHAVLAMPVLT